MQSLDEILTLLSYSLALPSLTDRKSPLRRTYMISTWTISSPTWKIGLVTLGCWVHLPLFLYPQRARSCSDDQFNTHGDEQLATIATHFTTTVVKETLLQEWSCFKYNNNYYTKIWIWGVVYLWGYVNTLSKFQFYRFVSYLGSIALILPVSKADCEREFLQWTGSKQTLGTDLRLAPWKAY